MDILYSGIVSFIVGLISGWFLASIRKDLGVKVAERKIRIGDIKKVESDLFAELYVTVGATSAGPLGFLLPLSIHNIRGVAKFHPLVGSEPKVYRGLRWLAAGLDVASIDITLPGEYELVIMTDNHGVLYPDDEIDKDALVGTFDITVEILGPTNKVITERCFPRAIMDGKIVTSN